MENDNHISGFIRGNRLARAGQPWTWGYVIFRTVYTAESDEHWASVLSKLEGYLFRELEHPLWWDYRSLAPEDIRAYPAPPQADPAVFEDFRKRLQHQIIDDKATLDGLSIVEVRQKFIDFESSIPVVKRMSLKSEWCLMIDNEVLKSIIAAPEPTRRSPEDMCLARGPGQPFIKVVAKDSGAGSDDPDYEGWMLASLNYLWALYQVSAIYMRAKSLALELQV
ncbi:hypothetical protein FQN57_002101 [Myotisia sp. PD_48]|nr:hypothetical protein FQN57_002101 [Myotisia sp. PD_48]